MRTTLSAFLSLCLLWSTLTLAELSTKALATNSGGWIPSMFSVLFDEASCNIGIDTDNDRLPDCVESNTGVFIDANNTGTDPNNADTDNDSISDGDEVLGTLAGLNLPAMGLNPLKKNILLEYDWFDDNLDSGICGAHSHQPTLLQMNTVSAAYANSPNINPDGSTGIVLIQDYGQGGVFSNGTLLVDADGVLVGGVSGAEFLAYKASDFDANRKGYFHYVILPHRYNTISGSSGQAEVNGDDVIVSLQCYISTRNVANTIMHELGHNLGLRHGGNENCNYKPNYNSVMNYKYQFPGVDNDCDSDPDGVLDYSRNQRISLDEKHLNENNGICNTPSIDWNANTVIELDISRDINSADTSQVGNCGDTLTTLNDFDDWANILYTGLGSADGLSPIEPEIISCDNPPPAF